MVAILKEKNRIRYKVLILIFSVRYEIIARFVGITHYRTRIHCVFLNQGKGDFDEYKY